MMLIILNGCAIEQEIRIRDFRNKMISDPSIPQNIRAAIINKQVMVGMTKDQVIASWGLPCGLCYGTRRSSNGDVWEYNNLELFAPGVGSYLYFDNNGILKYWSQ